MVQIRTKQTLILGYITVFLDIMGYYLIVPVLPYLSESLGATPTEEGILFSGYSVAQIASRFDFFISYLGLLIMGNYSDLYGRKFFLLFSLTGSFIGFFRGL